MVESDFQSLEKLFFALGDKTRLRILALMADGEVPVGFLADKLGESQPKVSRHLAYLRGSGIVETRRDGKWIYYAICYPQESAQRQILETVVRSIAAIGVDGKVDAEYIYFTEDQPSAEETPRQDNIYAKTYIYEPEDIYEDAAEEETVEDGRVESEEIEIFLL